MNNPEFWRNGRAEQLMREAQADIAANKLPDALLWADDDHPLVVITETATMPTDEQMRKLTLILDGIKIVKLIEP